MYGAYAAWVASVLCIGERTALKHCIAQDGLAHESLSAEELLYLTIGYDWLLFRSGRSVCINQSAIIPLMGWPIQFPHRTALPSFPVGC
jgi:hypothetical protein